MTIAEVLKESGYSTYISGKWHVGDAEQYWPEHRGFEQTFHIPNGGGVYFYPSLFPQRQDRLIYRNGEQVSPEPGWYSTDGFGQMAAEFIRRPENRQKPFFLYVPFIAPHYPLQAKPGDIEKYRGRYDAGYDAIRTARFKRQQEAGILDPSFEISAPEYPDWESLSDEKKARESLRMAVYAAQIDCIDQNVGRIVSTLKEEGLYENTVIIFLSDNGAVMHHFDDTPDRPYGGPDCWASVGIWQNVCNTPFRQGKGREFEGGIIPLLKGRHINRNRPLFFEHMGWKGMRQGRWKLVRKADADNWELYNLKRDPYETRDISQERKCRTRRMARKWEKWASEVGVEPWPLSH